MAQGNSSSKETGSWWDKISPRGRTILLLLGMLLVGVVAGVIISSRSDQGQNIKGVSSDQPIPKIQGQYDPGQTYFVSGESFVDICSPDVLEYCRDDIGYLFTKDVVQITGLPTLEGRDETYNGEWYWPAKVIYGSVYVEGKYVFIPDNPEPYYSIRLYRTEVAERPLPDFVAGEQVETSFNFVLRDGPAGSPLAVEGYGDPPLVMGGSKVIIVTGPTPGNDGHYYCQVDNDYIPLSWVPCEFAKT